MPGRSTDCSPNDDTRFSALPARDFSGFQLTSQGMILSQCVPCSLVKTGARGGDRAQIPGDNEEGWDTH